MADKKNKWDYMESLDRRYIWLSIFIVIIIPILVPLKLPLKIDKETWNVYNYIESLPENSNVFVSIDGSLNYWPGEIQPTAEAVMQHLFNRPLRIYIASFRWPDGPMIADMTFKNIDLNGKVYGVDYVNIGYFYRKVGMAAFATSIHKLTETDFYGNSLDELPMMKDVDDMNDFVVAFVMTDFGSITWQIGQWNAPYGIPMIGIGSTRIAPSTMPYRQTGQVVAMLATGVRAGAEYELIMKKPGGGLAMTDALSTSLLMAVVLTIIGNIGYFMKKRRQNK